MPGGCRVAAQVTRPTSIRAAGLLTFVAGCAVAVLAAVIAVGLFGCYGSSCSYELQGYGDGAPGPWYAVIGGLAGLAAAIALAGCAAALRGAKAGQSWSPVLTSLALICGGGGLLVSGLLLASA